MDQANKERGDVDIELLGKQYILRPTWQACIEIERATGEGLVPLARRVIAVDYGLNDAVAIVTAGLKATGEPASADAVGDMVMKTGLLGVGPSLAQFMTNALTGGEEPGEAKAADQDTSNTEGSPPSPTVA